VGGALLVARMERWLSVEGAVSLCACVTVAGLVLAGVSRHLTLSCAALFLVGAANILTIALLNVTVQFAAPRWVTGRALSLFQCALTGGIALGAGVWGLVATRFGVDTALYASAGLMCLLPLLGRRFPLIRNAYADLAPADIRSEPQVALDLSLRSGPIVVELDYKVPAERIADFYDAMLRLAQVRQRNGGFDWSLARDIGDPEIWTERYHCATWGDYLRLRTRFTQADIAAQKVADALTLPLDRPRVRRRLEQPFGSVRRRPAPEPPPVGSFGP
jgi:hypothetical protein